MLRKPLVFIDTYHEFLDFDFVDMNNEDLDLLSSPISMTWGTARSAW